MQELNSKYRLLLTGTPVMNKLGDFHSLVRFFSQGELLSTKAEFKRDFQE